MDLLQAVAVDGSGDNAGRVKGAAPQVTPHQVLRQARGRPGALQVVSDREIILKRPEWLGSSDISKVFVNTSQLGNCFSNISVAYSYHHQGMMVAVCYRNVGKTVSQLASIYKNLQERSGNT